MSIFRRESPAPVAGPPAEAPPRATGEMRMQGDKARDERPAGAQVEPGRNG
jgi:hypothetical protein